MSANETRPKETAGRKPGENYRNEEGILICGKCGEPRERMFPAGGIWKEPHHVPSMCRCQREEYERQQEEAERTERMRRTERLRKQCFPSSGRYASCTFDADDGRNTMQSTVCRAFAETFDPKDPEGLVLYGARGTGKSFHASCIANAVIVRGFSCLVTDIKQVVNLMESSFEKRSGNLERILSPDLLILEDLGAQRSTEYVMEHVYDVIDGRYKAGKPMVITTNFDYKGRILNAPADDPWGRVFDRIVEVGFPVKYDGFSRRREIGAKNRKDFRKKLGIEGIES